ncbi:hypothetical protein AX14_010734, partial [Amanita brunnescens Koide BX004]
MPLVDKTVYTIHNDLTGTVLDLSATGVRGWGLHRKNSQQWKASLVVGATRTWKFQNGGGNWLSPHENNQAVNRRLVGNNNVGTALAFFLVPIPGGATGKYKILCVDNAGQAVTLVPGAGLTPDVAAGDRVFDLQADGTPVALQAVVAPAGAGANEAEKLTAKNNQRAQIWSFVPVVEWPLADGTYKIINYETNTVLGFETNAAASP